MRRGFVNTHFPRQYLVWILHKCSLFPLPTQRLRAQGLNCIAIYKDFNPLERPYTFFVFFLLLLLCEGFPFFRLILVQILSHNITYMKNLQYLVSFLLLRTKEKKVDGSPVN